MIAIFNSLPVKEGEADTIVERFAESRGQVQGFPGFVSIEVLVITRWQNRAPFDAWVRSEELSPPSELTVSRLTLTTSP